MSKLALVVVALLVAPTAVDAAATRYVASFGNNSNNCTLNAPCRTLQRAVNVAPITIPADGITPTLVRQRQGPPHILRR